MLGGWPRRLLAVLLLMLAALVWLRERGGSTDVADGVSVADAAERVRAHLGRVTIVMRAPADPSTP